jgi:predicted nucleic acid-binding protein
VASSDLPALVVCDAGPLIHLDELRCLDLLNVYPEICVPEAVWGEVAQHRPSALRRRRVSLNHIDLIPEPTPELAQFFRAYALEAGEQEALRLMQQFPEAWLLTDDAAARAAAGQLGYGVQGTIGVIVQAPSFALRTKRQVLNLLQAIPRRSTLFVSQSLLTAVIERVRQ